MVCTAQAAPAACRSECVRACVRWQRAGRVLWRAAPRRAFSEVGVARCCAGAGGGGGGRDGVRQDHADDPGGCGGVWCGKAGIQPQVGGALQPGACVTVCSSPERGATCSVNWYRLILPCTAYSTFTRTATPRTAWWAARSRAAWPPCRSPSVSGVVYVCVCVWWRWRLGCLLLCCPNACMPPLASSPGSHPRPTARPPAASPCCSPVARRICTSALSSAPHPAVAAVYRPVLQRGDGRGAGQGRGVCHPL